MAITPAVSRWGEPEAFVVPMRAPDTPDRSLPVPMRRIAPIAARIRRVVLLGPAHRLPFPGIAYAGGGPVADPSAHRRSGGIDASRGTPIHAWTRLSRSGALFEVQLPFLRGRCFRIRVVPLLVGVAEPEQVARVINHLWGGAEPSILVKLDLSHYLDRDGRRVDRSTRSGRRATRVQALDHEAASRATPLCNAVEARRRGPYRNHARSTKLRRYGPDRATSGRVQSLCLPLSRCSSGGVGSASFQPEGAPALARLGLGVHPPRSHMAARPGRRGGLCGCPAGARGLLVALRRPRSLRGCIGRLAACQPSSMTWPKMPSPPPSGPRFERLQPSTRGTDPRRSPC